MITILFSLPCNHVQHRKVRLGVVHGFINMSDNYVCLNVRVSPSQLSSFQHQRNSSFLRVSTVRICFCRQIVSLLMARWASPLDCEEKAWKLWQSSPRSLIRSTSIVRISQLLGNRKSCAVMALYVKVHFSLLTPKGGSVIKIFDLLNSMIFDLIRSIDLRWLFDPLLSLDDLI